MLTDVSKIDSQECINVRPQDGWTLRCIMLITTDESSSAKSGVCCAVTIHYYRGTVHLPFTIMLLLVREALQNVTSTVAYICTSCKNQNLKQFPDVQVDIDMWRASALILL